jgi:hypothetical protein
MRNPVATADAGPGSKLKLGKATQGCVAEDTLIQRWCACVSSGQGGRSRPDIRLVTVPAGTRGAMHVTRASLRHRQGPENKGK